MIQLFVFLAACIVVGLIATKKGRGGGRFFLWSALPALPLMLAVSYALGNDLVAKDIAMPAAAFLCPIVGFIVVLMIDNDAQLAANGKPSLRYRRCPYCAEAVRKEAIRCRYCLSKLVAVR